MTLRRLVAPITLLWLSGCPSPGLDPGTSIPDASRCTAPVTLQAWAAGRTDSSGAVVVFGTAVAPDGVTIRSIYVAGAAVQETDFNFRSWTLAVTADRVNAIARNGRAAISVIAYTSAGCTQLPNPIVVQVAPTDAATFPDARDAQVRDGATDGPTDARKD